MESAFGIETPISAALICSLLCFIVFGGLKRIASFTTVVVPFMALSYIVVALITVFYNVDKIPAVFHLIFTSAFGMDSIFGGIVGTAVSWGVKRGLYSNEAGQGSVPTRLRRRASRTRQSRALCRRFPSTSTRGLCALPQAS